MSKPSVKSRSSPLGRARCSSSPIASSQTGGHAPHACSPVLFSSFFFFFLAEVLAHVTLLCLPYYWDEAGYYIPAAYDFFRTGSLIPFSTLTNAHPPGLSLYLAAAWKVFGFAPLTTRVSMCLAAALALVAVWRLAADSLGSRAAACALVLITAVYPVWFAQSTLAQADMLAAPFTLWALCFAWSPLASTRTLWAMCACFTAAALTKEIAIGTPLALATWEGVLLLRRRGDWRRLLAFTAPSNSTCPLVCLSSVANRLYLRQSGVSALQRERDPLADAGSARAWPPDYPSLGSPQSLRAGSHRTGLPAAATTRLPQSAAGGDAQSDMARAFCKRPALFAARRRAAHPLSVARVPVSAAARRRGCGRPASSAGSGSPPLPWQRFSRGSLLPAPYRIAPEDTLAYRDAIVLEQQAIAIVTRNYPNASVLSAWPVTDGLRKPELGYVRTRRLAVVPVDNFSLPRCARAAGAAKELFNRHCVLYKIRPCRAAVPLRPLESAARGALLRLSRRPDRRPGCGHAGWRGRVAGAPRRAMDRCAALCASTAGATRSRRVLL